MRNELYCELYIQMKLNKLGSARKNTQQIAVKVKNIDLNYLALELVFLFAFYIIGIEGSVYEVIASTIFCDCLTYAI